MSKPLRRLLFLVATGLIAATLIPTAVPPPRADETAASHCAGTCPIGTLCRQEKLRWVRFMLGFGDTKGFNWTCRPATEPCEGCGSYQDAACVSEDYCHLYAREVCPAPAWFDVFYTTGACHITCWISSTNVETYEEYCLTQPVPSYPNPATLPSLTPVGLNEDPE